jgi:hypothetical protein
VRDLGELAIDRYPTVRLTWRAYGLRDNVTAYGATYVALAEIQDCPLVTVAVCRLDQGVTLRTSSGAMCSTNASSG